MRDKPKVKRIQLKTNHSQKSVMLGIVSPEPDYKLSLILNGKLRVSLKNIPPVIINDPSGTELTFSRFSDSTASPDLVYELISNRSGKYFLLKKLKNIDYIFHVYNPDNEVDINQLTALLKDVECVSAVFNIDPGTIKDRNLQHITF